MISKELMEILACPETKTPVQAAPESLVRDLNGLIEKGELRNRDGEVINAPMDEGLVREDGTILYPVREDIPIMLIGEGIPLEGFEG